MSNYQDLSAILERGDFSEECVVPKESSLLMAYQIVKHSLTHNKESQEKTTQDQQNYEVPTNREAIDIEEFFPNHKAEICIESPPQTSENLSFQTQTPDPGEGRKKKVRKNDNDSIKNIIGNITKKSMDIMLNSKKHVLHVKRKCKEYQINYKDFERYFKTIMKKIYGPQSIVELFEKDKNNPVEERMKKLFQKVFTRIVRKRYSIYLLKKGKMKDADQYFRIKNQKLLYFADQVQNAMKMSGV